MTQFDQMSTPPLTSTSHGKTIVLVEDDPFIAHMYQTKLTGSGYSVIIEPNGRKALDLIRRLHPSLMIVDVNLPELSGLDLLAILAGENYDFNASPAMVLTNASDPHSQQQAESYGADYLVKADLTPREVLERIEAKLAGVA